MPINSLPALDVAVCDSWSEADREMYNQVPFFLAKVQVERKQKYPTFQKLVGRKKWTPNKGELMTGVRTEPAPQLRQFAIPTWIKNAPTKDVIDVRETTVGVKPHWHRFESPTLDFYPDFNDFLTHVNDHAKEVMKQIELYNDIFIRTVMFHASPFMFIVNGPGSVTLATPQFWKTYDASTMEAEGRNSAVMNAIINNLDGNGGVGPQGYLDMQALEMIATIMENDLGIPFFSGSDLPKEDAPLDGKYLLTLDSECYNKFTFDPWMLAHKNCSLDVIGNGYRGQFFGRVTTKTECNPIRFKSDGTYVAPELRAATGEYNADETLPNTDYTRVDVSPIGIAIMHGAQGYDALDVGPPPAAFTGDSPPDKFPSMKWNGEVYLTKNFLVPCVSPNTGEVIYEANSYGDKIRVQAQGTFGCLPKQRRNSIPIAYRRHRGAVTPA